MEAFANYEGLRSGTTRSPRPRATSDQVSQHQGRRLRPVPASRCPTTTRSLIRPAIRTASEKALKELDRARPEATRNPNMSATPATGSRSRAIRPRRPFHGESGATTSNSRNYTAAINRFRDVVAKYQTTRHVEEALERLTEGYLALGHHGRGSDGRRRARPQLPGQPLVQGCLRAPADSGGLEPREDSGILDQPILQGASQSAVIGEYKTAAACLQQLADPKHRPHRPTGDPFSSRG